MSIDELETLKKNMQREAKKWTAYLAGVPADKKEGELARKFMECWLEGRHGLLDGGAA